MAKIRSKDMIAQYEQIMSDLKNKIYRPIYVLMGDEPYYIDAISNYIADKVLNEADKAFNQTIMYGADVDARTIFLASARPPMMTNYQIVIVREAQNVKLDGLEKYFEKPLATTILVLCLKGKTVDKRTSMYKILQKNGTVFDSAKLYDNELSGWIITYLKKKKVEIDTGAAGILAEYIGADLTRIANELDKLFILLPEGSTKITSEHIEKNTGISKEYNSFELANALLSKNRLKTYRIINYFDKNPKAGPMAMTIPSLFAKFVQLLKYHILIQNRALTPNQIASQLGVNPFFLREYDEGVRRYSIQNVFKSIELLREYDMKGKGWNTSGNVSEGELMREFAAKILSL
ncbi:MAG: DNA polymerase III subunit delta [Prevotellaceae bacterium]|jgi:DNA polymerase-3 subunit delta|nr:DNA polymerase III subunit delta [Prevotellaceae bacterium]